MEQGLVERSPVTADSLVHPEPSQRPDPEWASSRYGPTEACGPVSRGGRRGQKSATRVIVRKGEVFNLMADATLDVGL